MFPESPIYSAFGNDSNFESAAVRYSALNRLPSRLIKKNRRPLACLAFSTMRMPSDDLIISSGHTGALWINPKGSAPWIHYCHTPARFIWMPDLLQSDHAKGQVRWSPYPLLQKFDSRKAQKPSLILANSRTVSRRIEIAYGRQAEVVYPPVDVEFYQRRISEHSQDHFLYVGRIEHYRGLWHLLEAVRGSGLHLRLVGHGAALHAMKAKYPDSNIQFMGWVPDDQLRAQYAMAQAVIIPGEEDFCITAVEALACGTPVIALRRGGVTETVTDGVTGMFVDDLERLSLLRVMRESGNTSWDREVLRKSSLRFSEQEFRNSLGRVIDEVGTFSFNGDDPSPPAKVPSPIHSELPH